jgi:hypothetical protein
MPSDYSVRSQGRILAKPIMNFATMLLKYLMETNQAELGEESFGSALILLI